MNGLRCLSLVAVTTLAACGGGGGSGSTDAPGTSAPRTYSLGKQTVKDFASRKAQWQRSEQGKPDTSGTVWENVVTTTAGADGSYTTATVWDYEEIRAYSDYTPDGAQKSYGNACHFIYTPAYAEVPGTLTPGQSWETSTVRTCTNSSSENTPITSKGSVAGIETVTVAAGTFTALKTVTTSTFKFARSTTVANKTCWRDTVTGINVKCDYTYVRTLPEATQAASTSKWQEELVGFAHAASGRQKLNVERFVGTWQVWFQGSADGTCAVKIDTAGSVAGRCENNYGIPFEIVGSVDAQGVARFGLSGNGVSGPGFSGSFESPLKIAGTWTAGTDSGTWYMLHM